MNGGREHVVGRLPHVHVVVGMDRLFFRESIAANDFDRAVGDDFIGVHIARSAGAGLENIERELAIEFAFDNFAAGLEQGIDVLGADGVFAGAGELAEITVGDGGRVFDQAEGMDQLGGQRLAGDGEVFDGALGLSAVVSLGRDVDLAHRIVFNAVVGHGRMISDQEAVDLRARSILLAGTKLETVIIRPGAAGVKRKAAGTNRCGPVRKRKAQRVLASVQSAGVAVALRVGGAEAITAIGDLAIEPLPKGEAAGDVQDGHQPPKAAESAREITNGLGAAVATALAIDHVHLRHQHVVRQSGIERGDLRIV